MAEKQLKRPRDPVQLGKLLGDILTGQVEDKVEDGKSAAAVEMGRKGGAARAANLTKKKRREIAKKGAAARWQDKQ